MLQPDQKRDLTDLASGAGVSLGGKIAGGVLNAAAQMLLARVLGPAGFGIYALGLTVLRMVSVIAPLGLRGGVVRFASRYLGHDQRGLNSLLVQSLGLAFLLGLAAAIALVAAAPWLANEVFGEPALSPVLRLFAVAFPIVTTLKVAAGATLLVRRTQFAVVAEDLAPATVNLCLLIGFYFLGMRLLGSVLASVLSFSVGLLLALLFLRRLFPEVFAARLETRFVIGELLRFSATASVAGVLFSLTSWVDRLSLGYFRTPSEVGVYQAACQVTIFFPIVLGAFGTMLSPMTADLHQKGNLADLQQLFRISTRWSLYASIPVGLVLWFATSPLIIVVFGPPYASGALPLVVLAVGQIVNAGTGAVGLVLIMTGHEKSWLVLSAAALILDTLLNLALVPHWGATGAAVATSCSVSALSVCGLYELRRRLGLWPYDRSYRKGLVATGLAAAVLLCLPLPSIRHPIAALTLALAASLGTFVSALIVLRLEPEDRELWRLIWTRLVLLPQHAARS